MRYCESFLSRTSASPLILVAKRTHVLAHHGTMPTWSMTSRNNEWKQFDKSDENPMIGRPQIKQA